MKLIHIAIILNLGLLATAKLAAQIIGTWNENVNGNWSTNNNWLSQVIPNDVGHTAIINRDINPNRTINLDIAVTLGALILGDQNATHSYTLSGSTLTFDNADHIARFNKSLGVSGDIISSNINLNDNLIFNITTGGSFNAPANALTQAFTINGVISGSSDFIKLGGGNLILAGANTLTGNFIFSSTGGAVLLNSATGPAISSPVLQIGNSNRDGNSTATVQLPTNTATLTTLSNQIADTTLVRFDASTATFGNRQGFLRLLGNNETVGGLQDTSREGVVENTGSESGVGANGIIGINTAAGTQYTFAGFLRDKAQQIDDPLSPSSGRLGVVKSGLGTQILRGDRVEYSGSTTINDGRLVLSNINHFFTADSNNTSNPNQRNLLPVLSQVDPLSFNSDILLPGQFPRLLSPQINVAAANATLELNATTLWTLGTNIPNRALAPNALNLADYGIQGSGTVVKTGNERLIVTGPNHGFTGTLKLESGRLRLDSGVLTLEQDNSGNYLRYGASAGENENRLRALYTVNTAGGNPFSNEEVSGNGSFINATEYLIESGELEIVNYANNVLSESDPNFNPNDPNRLRITNLEDTGTRNGRLSNSAPIVSRGGAISFSHQGVSNFSERVGKLELESGVLTISADTAGFGNTSLFSFNGLTREPVAGVTRASGINFIYNDENFDPNSSLRIWEDGRNKIVNRSTSTATNSNGIIGSWAIVSTQEGLNLSDYNFARYVTDSANPNLRVVVPYSYAANENPNSNLISTPLIANNNYLIDNSNTSIASSLYNNSTRTISINSLKLDDTVGEFNIYNSNATPSPSDINPVFRINSGGIISKGVTQIRSSQSSTTPISIQPGSAGNGAGVNEFNFWVVPSSSLGSSSLEIQNTVTLDDNGSAFNNIVGSSPTIAGNPSRLVKNGPGELRLLGVNRYTGGTVINQGGIEISNVGALGQVGAGFSSTNPMLNFLDINGGVLQISGNQTVFSAEKGITLGVNGGTFGVGANGTLIIQSPITGAGSLRMGGNNVQGSSSSGTLQLEGNNTFTGTLNVDVGSVIIAGGSNQFSAVSISGDELVVNESSAFTGNGAVSSPFASVSFPVNSSDTAAGSLIINQNLIIGALSSGGNSGGLVQGKASVAGAVTLTIDQDINTTFQGRLEDGANGGKALAIKKKGAGILTLTSSDGSTHTGGVEVEEGIIAFNRINERTATSGTFSSLGLVSTSLSNSVSSASLIKIGNGAALSFIGDLPQVTNRPFTIGTGTEGIGIYANGTNTDATISFKQGRLFDNTNAVIGNDAIAFSTPNQKATLNLGGLNTGNNQFQLILSDNGTGALELVKTGTGRWILGDSTASTASSSSYTGDTSIYAGTVVVAQDRVFGAADSGTVNLIGGNLDLDNVNYASNKQLIIQGGRLRALEGINNHWAGAVVLASTSAVEVGSNAKLNLSGAISGSSQLQKRGFGTLVLSGTNSFSGGLNIFEGTVQLDYTAAPGAKISNNGALTLGGGLNDAILDVRGTTNLAGSRQNFGSLTLNAGINRITRNDPASNTVVRVNAITVNQRGVLDISAAANINSFVQTDRLNQGGANGILGGWATVAQTGWAQNSTNTVDAFIRAVPTYANNVWTSGNNTDITSNISIANGITTSLRYNTPTSTLLQLTGVNQLEANGILQTANVGSSSNRITGGSIRPSNTRDGANLYVHQYGAQSLLTIESAIENADSINFTFDTIAAIATPTSPTSTIRVTGAAASNLSQFYVGQTITGNFGLDAQGNPITTATINQTSVTNPNLTDPSTGVAGTALILLNRTPVATATNVNSTASGNTSFIKIGDGLVTLRGANTYLGPTLITSGTLSINSIANGGVASPLGQSSNAAGNVVFSGSTLQYTGVSASTDRGLTLNDFGAIDISLPGTELTIRGNLAGTGRLLKNGAGTLVLDSGVVISSPTVTTQTGGSNSLTDIEVADGRLVLQYNNPNTSNSNNRFANSAAGLKLEGGALHLKGLDNVASPVGNSGVQLSENRFQQFLGQFTIGAGASEVKVTNGDSTLTTLVIQNPNSNNPIVRDPGGTVHFITETVPQSIQAVNAPGFLARIFLGSNLQGTQPLYFATFLDRSEETDFQRDFGTRVENFAVSRLEAAVSVPGVGNNNFVPQIQTAVQEVQGPNAFNGTVTSFDDINAAIVASSILSEGVNDNQSTFNRTLPTTKIINQDDPPVPTWFNVANALLYQTHQDSTLIIPETGTGPQQDVFLLTGGAILNSSITGNFSKRIEGGRLQSGNLVRDGENEFIIHNWNPAALLDAERSTLEIGSNISDYSIDIDGPDGPEIANTPIMTHLTHVGNGTTLLDGNNSYTGTTFLNGGVLRVRGAGALGAGLLRLDGGVLGLEADFTRALGTGSGQVAFGGSGGFTAYGADRNVNLGGAAAPVQWGANSFVPDSSALLLSSQDATGKVTIVNPINLGPTTRVIEVRDAIDSALTVEAELSGVISGSGQIEKTGYGTLSLTGANTFSGGVSLAQGNLNVSSAALGTGEISIATSSSTRKTDVLNFSVTGDATLTRLNVGNQNNQGFTSLVSNGNLQFSQGGKLDGLLNFDIGSANQVAVDGNLTGTTGALQVSGGGKLILNGSSGLGIGTSGNTIDIYTSTLIRNGTVVAGNSAALGGSVVELGDIQRPLGDTIVVDRATGSQSVLVGGYYEPENPAANQGAGTQFVNDAFVFEDRVSIIIDGKEYTIADQNTRILVNGEVEHPERNGIYEIKFRTTSSGNNFVALVRPTEFKETTAFEYGDRIRVTNGSAQNQTLTVVSNPTTPDTSPLVFIKAADVSTANNAGLLVSNNGTTLTNAVDINYTAGTTYRLGGADTFSTGTANLNGAITLRNLVSAAERARLQLVSSTNIGNGIAIRGRISEASSTSDRLDLFKTGSGIVSLYGANTYTGGTTVSAGTLLVNNLAGSGTGSGVVNVQGQGTTLGGTGIIAGTTTIGSGGILSPGDPLVNNGLGTLEFLRSLTLRDNTQVLFTLGSETSFDRLIARGNLTLAPSTRLEVVLDFIPTESFSWDILDWSTTSSNLLSSLELPTLAQSALFWDTSAFNSTGVISLAEITAATIPPARFAIREADVAEDAVRVEVAVQLQWASTRSITVPLSVSTGTGSATSSATGDVVISPSSVTFAPGETNKVVSINIRDDQVNELTERLVVNLRRTSTNALAAQSTFTLTIRDNDPVQLGSSWRVVNPVATNEAVRDIAFNGTNQYLAVGTCGLLMTSPDGTTWTPMWVGVSQNLNAVEWFQNRWVVAGNSGITLSSADGDNWTIGSIGQSAAVNDLVVSGTTLVAVGDNGVAATTADALAWTTQATSIITDIHSIANTGTLLVAVGENMKALISADNGTTWTVVDVLAGSTLSLRGITAHGTGVIAVGDGGSVYVGAVSGSTVTWTVANSGVTQVLNAVHSNGSAIVAVGNSGTAIRSTNGTTWTSVVVGVTSNLEHVGQGSTATTLLAGGASGVILSSADSTTWTRIGSGSTQTLKDVIYVSPQYVAIGENGLVLTSTDGDTWIAGTTGSAQQLKSLAHNGSLFVAVGDAGSIFTSANGTTWTAVTSGVSQDLHRVAFGGGRFVTVGEAGTILTSTNGTTWTDVSSTVSTANLGGVVYNSTGAGQWLAVGDAGAVLLSQNGITWSRTQTGDIPSGADFNAVTWTTTHYVAVGDAGSIAVSTNGTTWTLPSADTANDLHNVSYFSSPSVPARILAVGAAGTVTMSTSTTATTWVRQLTRTCLDIHGVASNTVDLVIVGSDGSILESFTPTVSTPQLGFVVDSMSASERSGTVNAIVRLSPSSNVPVTVGFSVTAGTATVATDYRVITRGTTLTFRPGDTELPIAIQLVDDAQVEGNETLSVTLSTISPATVTSSGINALTLTIENDDAALVYTPTTLPNQILPAGSPLTLSYNVTGSTPLTTQWLRNRVAVRGALSSTLSLPSLSIADGGAYSLRITNNVNPTGPTPAVTPTEIAVVDTAARLILVRAGSRAVLTQAAGGNGLTYQWLRTGGGGSSQAAATSSPTLSIASVPGDTSQAGEYICTVTGPGGSLAGGPVRVAVARIPVIVDSTNTAPTAPVALSAANVGQFYSAQVLTNTPTFNTLESGFLSGYATSYSATGLPTGLTINRTTGLISGVPSVATVSPAVVRVRASNIAGTSAEVIYNITVNALATNVVGTFVGLFPREPVITKDLGARLTLTTTARGSFTGNLTIGFETTSFKGNLIDFDPTLTRRTCSVVVTPRVPTGRRPRSITINMTLDPVSNLMEATMSAGTAPSITTVNLIKGWRSTFSRTAPSELLIGGQHNVVLKIPTTTVINDFVPAGHSYMGINLARVSSTVAKATGTITLSGKTSDGSSRGANLIGSTFLGPNGEVLFYHPLYGSRTNTASTGSFIGIATIGSDVNNVQAVTQAATAAQGRVTWTRPVQPRSANLRNYPSGFVGALELELSGGRYVAPFRATSPNSSSIILGGALVPPTTTSVGVSITFSGANINPDPLNLPFQIRPTTTVVGAPVSITFSATTGTFTGSYILVDGVPPALVTRRTVSFFGLIVPDLTTPDTASTTDQWDGIGFGHFLLEQIPDPRTNLILSGQVELRRQ